MSRPYLTASLIFLSLACCACSLFQPIRWVDENRKRVSPKEIARMTVVEVQIMDLQPGDTLLDIGSGTGTQNALYATQVAGLHQELTDIDTSRR